jgi:hypothetical protein
MTSEWVTREQEKDGVKSDEKSGGCAVKFDIAKVNDSFALY